MQDGIRKKLQPAGQVFGQEFGADGREIRPCISAKRAAYIIQISGKLLRRPGLCPLPQKSGRDRSETFLTGGIGGGSGFYESKHIDQWNAAFLHQQHGHSILQNKLIMRRNAQRLRGRHGAKQEQESEERKKRQYFPLACHCFAFSSFSGSSVATVRLFAPKYFFATRCTSSFVTAE